MTSPRPTSRCRVGSARSRSVASLLASAQPSGPRPRLLRPGGPDAREARQVGGVKRVVGRIAGPVLVPVRTARSPRSTGSLDAWRGRAAGWAPTRASGSGVRQRAQPAHRVDADRLAGGVAETVGDRLVRAEVEDRRGPQACPSTRRGRSPRHSPRPAQIGSRGRAACRARRAARSAGRTARRRPDRTSRRPSGDPGTTEPSPARPGEPRPGAPERRGRGRRSARRAASCRTAACRSRAAPRPAVARRAQPLPGAPPNRSTARGSPPRHATHAERCRAIRRTADTARGSPTRHAASTGIRPTIRRTASTARGSPTRHAADAAVRRCSGPVTGHPDGRADVGAGIGRGDRERSGDGGVDRRQDVVAASCRAEAPVAATGRADVVSRWSASSRR